MITANQAFLHPCLTDPRKSAPRNPHSKKLTWGCCHATKPSQNQSFRNPHTKFCPHSVPMENYNCIRLPHANRKHFDVPLHPHSFDILSIPTPLATIPTLFRKIRKSEKCPDFPIQSPPRIRLPARPTQTAPGETRPRANFRPCVGDRGG